MTETAKEKYNAYMREWRKNNPDACKKYKENYWEKKAAQEKEQRQKERQ